MYGERDLKVYRSPRVSGSARRGPLTSRTLCGLPSRPPFPLSPSPATQQDPPKGKNLGVTSGPLRLDKTALLAPSSPGISGQLQRETLFCGKGRWERMEEERARVSQSLPRGRAPHLGGVGRWEPPGGAPRFLPALRTLLGLEHPKRRAPPSPGLLTDSADTQATKPKVSRIQARRIFPRGPADPAAACNQSGRKPLAQRPAQPAQRDLEQRSRNHGGSGWEALAPSSCACSRVLDCAPRTRRLLTCWCLHS